MPERSFGRTIRFRRTKLGLSQGKLGELVGRSPSTIRSWERDDSTPNDPEVLMALAAVLGVEQRTLFDKAGVDRPDMETSPTLEQELATLRPTDDEDDKELEIRFTYDELASLRDKEKIGEDDQEPAVPARAPRVELVPDFSSDDDSADLAAVGSVSIQPVSPAYADPPAAFVVTRVDQTFTEPSYMEDLGDRQIYRVRHVGTAVGIVVMLLLLIYAAGKGLEAFGDWWDSFFGQLRL